MKDWDCYLDDYVNYDDTMMMTESEIRELVVDEHDRYSERIGFDVEEWTDDQQNEFVQYLDENNAGIEFQIQEWIPNCIVAPADFDISVLTSDELRTLLLFVRGDESEGAVPLV